MVSNTLLAAGFVMSIIAVIFLICSVVLILVVLIQKGKGGGLSSAFAGGMASGLLGSKTGDVLTWVTIGVVSILLLFAIILNKWWKPTVSPTSPTQPQTQSSAPAEKQAAPTNQQDPMGQPQSQTPGK